MKRMTFLNRRYHDHKNNAKKKGILFLLTFEEWLSIWEESGKLDKRGRGKGQYVMARNNDEGPYEVGNVRVITSDENHKEYKYTEEVCRKISRAKIGENHHLAKLTEKIVASIFISKGTNSEIGKKFGISASHVWLIKNRKIWTSVTKDL